MKNDIDFIIFTNLKVLGISPGLWLVGFAGWLERPGKIL